jgi:perosamine synthetase
MNIKYRVSVPYIDKQESINVNIAIKNNELSGFFGRFIPKFEKKFSSYCKTKYALSVTSGTTALHLGLLAVGIKKDDHVIVSSLTNMASIFAILYIGAIPIGIDIEEKTFNLDVSLIEKKITKKTKAILAVHLFGHPAEMSEIMRLAKKYKLKVIEDCAEAHGAEYEGRKVGSFGDAGCFSFYANKIISTGEGGMVTFNSSKYYNKAKNLKELAFGEKNKFMHKDIGYNYRMTNLQAAIGCAQMKKINFIVQQKIKIAKLYDKYLAKNSLIIRPYTKKNVKNVFWMYCVSIPSFKNLLRKKLMKKLIQKGIETREMFIPCNLQNIFLKKKLFKRNQCPRANLVAYNTFYLPSGVDLSEKDIKFICNELNKLVQ